jgi:type IV pilus assembly protein PilB
MSVAPATVVDFLAGTTLFRGCDRGTIEKIAPHVFAAQVPANTIIVRAGTPDPGIGFLFSGCAVVRGIDVPTGKPVVIEEVGVGDAFGETGAFLGTTQPHDVVAETDCTVLLLGHDLIQQIATKVAAFSFAAARRLAARVVTTPPPNPRSTRMSIPPVGSSLSGLASASSPGGSQPGGASDVRFVRVSAYDPGQAVLSLVPAKVIQQHRLLPLEQRDRMLLVGMVDPLNTASRAELQRVLQSVDVSIVAISQDDFNEAFVRLRIDSTRSGRSGRQTEPIPPEALQFDIADQEREAKQVGMIGDDMVAMASRIIAQAIERGASDVHIENDVLGPRIRFRVQGQLYDWDQTVPSSYAKGLVARFKVLSGLDITERRLPQDGRIGLKVGRREVDIRVSTIPTSRGEKLALRVFEAATMSRPLESIFFDNRVLEAVRAVIQRPYGAIIIAGPTGSGKTSSLYGALAERKRTRPDTNILTVEDPIEYRLGGVTQVQVNHGVELTFAKVLRAMLRQDPDVIMVGEVRDQETAVLALEAAMTGHLLFTSIHANNAVGGIQRLENLGCGRPLIGQALATILVQRLARKLCSSCCAVELPPPIMIENLAAHGLIDRAAPPALPRAVGCSDCNGTGYNGRVAVVEMLQLNEPLRAQIMAEATLSEIEAAAAESGALVSFRRSAIHLMNRQLISPTEALLTLT